MAARCSPQPLAVLSASSTAPLPARQALVPLPFFDTLPTSRHVGQAKRPVVPQHRPNTLLRTRAAAPLQRAGALQDGRCTLQVTVAPAGLVTIIRWRRHVHHVAVVVVQRRENLPGGDDGGARTPADKGANVGGGGAADDSGGSRHGRRGGHREEGNCRRNGGHEGVANLHLPLQ